MNSLTEKRKRYYTMIWQYKKRRDELRVRLARKDARGRPIYKGSEYNKAVKAINQKIKIWSRNIKRIDMITNKIIALGNAVAYFTGMNVKNAGKNQEPKMMNAKFIFYKYGIENLEIEQKLLREYVGAKRVTQPAEYRKKFNSLLREFPLVREQWAAFKLYYENQPVCTDDFIDKRRAPGS